MVLETFVVNPAEEHPQRRVGTLYGGDSRSQEDRTPMMKIELVVTNEIATKCTKAIIKAARTTTAGDDGTICITQVEGAVRIRTGEVGESAV
jgi:nitrogen regulatory protein PII